MHLSVRLARSALLKGIPCSNAMSTGKNFHHHWPSESLGMERCWPCNCPLSGLTCICANWSAKHIQFSPSLGHRYTQDFTCLHLIEKAVKHKMCWRSLGHLFQLTYIFWTFPRMVFNISVCLMHVPYQWLVRLNNIQLMMGVSRHMVDLSKSSRCSVFTKAQEQKRHFLSRGE